MVTALLDAADGVVGSSGNDGGDGAVDADDHEPGSLTAEALAELTPEERAMVEADRFAEHGVLPWMPPVPAGTDFDALYARRPAASMETAAVDPLLRWITYASGTAPDDFMTYPQRLAAARRKTSLLYFTRDLEAAAALVVAAGVTDAVITTVASYMQHLMIGARGKMRDLMALEETRARRRARGEGDIT